MRFKNLRNTVSGWAADDKVIAQGEIALLVTTLDPGGEVVEMRYGDGMSPFSQLSAFAAGGGGGGSGGGGITSIESAPDVDTVDLPVLNIPTKNALALKVPTIRTVGGAPLSANVDLKTFAGESIVGVGDIPSLGGIISIGTAPDVDTVDLPTLNMPLNTALAAKVPTSRTVGGAPLSANVNLKTLAGQSLVGTGDIPSTGGITTIAAATDKATIDLPTVNNPLSAALAIKVPTSRTVGGVALTANIPVRTVGGQDLFAGGGDVPIGAVDNDLNPSTTRAPSKTAVSTALLGKVDLVANVDLGTGSASLGVANAWAYNYWHGSSDANLTFTSASCTRGQVISVGHEGSTGILSLLGEVNTPTGYKNTVEPGETGTLSFNGTAWVSGFPDSLAGPSGGGSGTGDWITVSGSNVTGSLLVATRDNSQLFGTYQWVRDGTNIGTGAPTYTLVTADEGHVIKCRFTPTYFESNGIAAVLGGSPITTTFGRNTGNVGDVYIGCIDGTGTVGIGDATEQSTLVHATGVTLTNDTALNSFSVVGLNSVYTPGVTVTAVTLNLMAYEASPGAGGPFAMRAYHSLKDITYAGYPDYTPSDLFARAGIAWEGQCASGASDRSVLLASSPAVAVGGNYTIGSTAALVALFQAAINGAIDKVDMLVQLEPTSGGYRVYHSGGGGDGLRPYATITVVS